MIRAASRRRSKTDRAQGAATSPPSGTLRVAELRQIPLDQIQRKAPDGSLIAEPPPGLTRIIREFYRTITKIRAEDLTAADRSALRALFQSLVMLARTPTTPRARVFSALPPPRGPRPGRGVV